MSEPALIRNCDGCTLCCKVFDIEALAKPEGTWCSHCTIGVGCNTYDSRPTVCRTFYCGYLLDATLGEEWKPAVSKLVLVFDSAQTFIAIRVDTSRPDSWRREPYYARIKEWAVQMARVNKQVMVNVGTRTIVVLPHKEVDLGEVGPDQKVVTQWVMGPGGPLYEAFKWAKDDPRLTKSSRANR